MMDLGGLAPSLVRYRPGGQVWRLTAGLHPWYYGFMHASSSETMKPSKITKKVRAPETGTPVQVRLQPEDLAKLDAWLKQQEGVLTRAEAFRRLLETHPAVEEVVQELTAAALEAEAQKKGKKR